MIYRSNLSIILDIAWIQDTYKIFSDDIMSNS